MTKRAEHPIDQEMRWNFGNSRGTSISLDEFLDQIRRKPAAANSSPEKSPG
jgi:hypothetical protein